MAEGGGKHRSRLSCRQYRQYGQGLSKWSQDCHHAAISSASAPVYGDEAASVVITTFGHSHLVSPKHIEWWLLGDTPTTLYTTIHLQHYTRNQNITKCHSADQCGGEGDCLVSMAALYMDPGIPGCYVPIVSLYSLKLQTDVQCPASAIPLKLCVFNSISCCCCCGCGGGFDQV